uniref:Uncharacterized protein n=1 Tax=Anguilla anguilla TaxID=7936 RepID=A0A0E9X012_ANGAN
MYAVLHVRSFQSYMHTVHTHKRIDCHPSCFKNVNIYPISMIIYPCLSIFSSFSEGRFLKWPTAVLV